MVEVLWKYIRIAYHFGFIFGLVVLSMIVAKQDEYIQTLQKSNHMRHELMNKQDKIILMQFESMDWQKCLIESYENSDMEKTADQAMGALHEFQQCVDDLDQAVAGWRECVQTCKHQDSVFLKDPDAQKADPAASAPFKL